MCVLFVCIAQHYESLMYCQNQEEAVHAHFTQEILTPVFL